MATKFEEFQRALDLPAGFRRIRDGDAAARLLTGEPQMDAYSLADYVAWSRNANSLVVVRVDGDDVANAAAWITIEGEIVTLEMLGRDRDSPPGLLAMIVRIIERAARKAGFREIRLDAISEGLVAVYGARGFVQSGHPYAAPGWSTLIPMRKML